MKVCIKQDVRDCFLVHLVAYKSTLFPRSG